MHSTNIGTALDKMEVIPLKFQNSKTCSICGDHALSCNFGAITCESCKAFFRRNAHKEELIDECQNNCTMTKETRSFCKSCRLQKCFYVGMDKKFIWTKEDKERRKRIIEENRYKKIKGGENMAQIEKLDKIADPNSFQGAYISSLKKGAKPRMKIGKNVKSTSMPRELSFTEVIQTNPSSGCDQSEYREIIDTPQANPESSRESMENFVTEPKINKFQTEETKTDIETSTQEGMHAVDVSPTLPVTSLKLSEVEVQKLPNIETIMNPKPVNGNERKESPSTDIPSTGNMYVPPILSNNLPTADHRFPHNFGIVPDHVLRSNEQLMSSNQQIVHDTGIDKKSNDDSEKVDTIYRHEIDVHAHNFHENENTIRNPYMYNDHDNQLSDPKTAVLSCDLSPKDFGSPIPMEHSHVSPIYPFEQMSVTNDAVSNMRTLIPNIENNKINKFDFESESTSDSGNSLTSPLSHLEPIPKFFPKGDCYLQKLYNHDNGVSHGVCPLALESVYSKSIPDYVMQQLDYRYHKHLAEVMLACEISYEKALIETIKKQPDLSDSFNQLEGYIKKSVVFAKNLFGFSSLPQLDQVALVKGSFIELMCVLFFHIFYPDRQSFYVRHRLPENPDEIVITETKVGTALNSVAEGNRLMAGYVFLCRMFSQVARNDPAVAMLLMGHILFIQRENVTYINADQITYNCELYTEMLRNYLSVRYPKGEIQYSDIMAMVPKIAKNCTITQSTLDRAPLDNLSDFTLNIFDK